MSIREFTDAGGVRWQVWATTPTRGNVRPQFASGWLAFECGAERRRLAPFPPGWTEADTASLRALLARATVVDRGPAAPPPPVMPVPADPAPAPDGAGLAPLALESTVSRVRAVLREVEESWRRPPAD